MTRTRSSPTRRSNTPASARRRAAWVAVASLGVAGCSGSAPLPTEIEEARVDPVVRPAVVRGLYVNAQAAGSASHLATLLALADGSAVNTFVVDVKERGEVSYASGVALARESGAERGYIEDLPGLLQVLRDHGIYPIARIVCFRDPILADARPDLAIRTADGRLWRDPESGRPWVDPFNAEVWAYNVALAEEALAAGFAEIQWDYVRLPDVTGPARADMVFPSAAGREAPEAIEDFIATSRRDLAGFGAPVTADVFGRVITAPDDTGIGQHWDGLVRVTDVLLPMVYPALYWPGNFGIPDPNAEPYRLVRAAMDSAVARMSRTDGAIATLRPWLQAFTEGRTVYGADQMRAQIRAVEDAGLQEWLFWNPASVYPTGAF